MKNAIGCVLNILLAGFFLSVSVNVLSADLAVVGTPTSITIKANIAVLGGDPKVAVHEDFDAGEAGKPLNGWSLGSSHNSPPVYSNFTSVTDAFSGVSGFEGLNYNSSAEYKKLPELGSAYVSYYFRIQKLNGANSRNIKLLRLSGGYKSGYVQGIGMTQFHTYNNGIFLQASIDNAESKVPAVWIGDYSDGKWHRAEYYTRLSNPAGAKNGATFLRVDGKVLANMNNIVNEEAGMRYKWLTLPYYVAHDAGGDYKIYYDNVIVSEGRARVEMCDSDTYSTCKIPSLAKVLSWTSSEVQISVGNFNGANPFLFVFDENDVLLNEKGIKFCPKCPKPPMAL